MPPYAVYCASCAADKSLLYVRRHWTGCSCHQCFFTLLAKGWAPLLIYWGIQTLFSSPQTRPSPSPPYSALLMPPVRCYTFLAGSVWLERGVASSLSPRFVSSFLCFSVLCRATGGERTVPWQHWQLKTCICLSCTLAVCFSSLFFSVYRWMSRQARVPGKQMASRKRKKGNSGRKK